MSIEPSLHPVQNGILRALLFKTRARFSDLNTENIGSDHLTFHVKRLVDLGLIQKESDEYELTALGKEFANRFDSDSGAKIVFEKQAKIGALIACVKKEGGVKKYLVQQRLKQPYYGFHGFTTGKVKWGETLEEAAARELKEETGLEGKLTLVGIKHKMDYSQDGKLLEDKYFFVFRGSDTKGDLTENFEGGRNLWLTEGEIKNLPDLFDGVDETIAMVNQENLMFSETKYKVSKY